MNMGDLSASNWKGLLAASILLCIGMAGCANSAIEDARQLAMRGQHEAALKHLQSAFDKDQSDRALRNELVQQKEVAIADLAHLAEAAKSAERLDDVRSILARMTAIAPEHPRTEWLRSEVARIERHQRLLVEAQKQLNDRQYDRAEIALRTVLSEDPGNGRARAKLDRISEMLETQTRQQTTVKLKTGDRPVTLEFRDASIKTVLESFARAADVNFVFDHDVKPETKVSLFLKNTTVDEAMQVLLNTQQLGGKLLNDNTVLIYPATQQKQRDLLDTVTRTFYLVNADAKQVQTMVRTMAKSRDIYVDDRLNVLMVRDTPEVVRLVEKLIQNIDLPDAEVMMELEVLEVSGDDLNSIGITWPSTVSYGIPGSTAPLSTLTGLKSYTTNPLALATLQARTSKSNILANPRIRAKNREKAHVLLGEKVPVFTTTSTLGASTVSAPTTTVAITYLDVGLKLDVEPQIQLDNDVTLKVALEVSSITSKVSGPADSVAYQVGTRQATTTLRLRDGETQILAGLINDSESHSSAGLPYLSEMPLLGRLFGLTSSEKKKTEIVLLVTPHIVRNLMQPSQAAAALQSGTDSQPGVSPLVLNNDASTLGGGGARGLLADVPMPVGASPRGAISGPEAVLPGASFQVLVRNDSADKVNTTLVFDPALFDAVGMEATNGRIELTLPAQGSATSQLKAKTDAAPGQTILSLDPAGAFMRLRIQQPEAATGGRPQ